MNETRLKQLQKLDAEYAKSEARRRDEHAKRVERVMEPTAREREERELEDAARENIAYVGGLAVIHTAATNMRVGVDALVAAGIAHDKAVFEVHKALTNSL